MLPSDIVARCRRATATTGRPASAARRVFVQPVRKVPSLWVRAAASYEGASVAMSTARRAEVKRELRRLLADIAAVQGPAAALLPGSPSEKSRIDELLQELQELQAGAEAAAAGQLQPSSIDRLLLGEWELVYASNGTVVTRTPLVQTLVSLSKSLPGAGICDIRQQLTLDGEGVLHASNEAVIGLGPLGSWRLGIEGAWYSQGGDGRSVRVVFEKVRLKPVGILGAPLPAWLPQAIMGSAIMGPADSQSRSGADWVTPYVDEDMRLGMGKSSGNMFLFFRK